MSIPRLKNSPTIFNKKSLIVAIIVIVITLGILFFIKRAIHLPNNSVDSSQNQKNADVTWKDLDKTAYVAQVNSEGVSREDYQKKLEQTKNFFISKQQTIPDMHSLKENILNGMIDDSLVSQYAQKQKITVSDDEVSVRYSQVVLGYNRRSNIKQSGDSAFLEKINELYGINKTTYLAELKKDILKEKVQDKVKMPLAKWLEDVKRNEYLKKYN